MHVVTSKNDSNEKQLGVSTHSIGKYSHAKLFTISCMRYVVGQLQHGLMVITGT